MKVLYISLGLIILSVASVYIFIPNQIIVSSAEQVESSDRIIADCINNHAKRELWWPKTSLQKSITPISKDLVLNGYEYRFNTGNLSSANVLIIKDELQSNSVITWESVAKSTYKITWRTALKASNNPIERFLQYQRARQVKQNMNLILVSFLTFIVDSKKIYGIKIDRTMVRDTILATSTILTASYPETAKIYNLINEVKAYAVKNGGKPVNVPMLNVSRDPKGAYNTMVALPIDKNIKSSNAISVNRMVPGNILVTEIKGGPGNVAEGFIQIKNYMNDFKLTSPAMPFESLVTDRSKEPDTSKWITKIYYPIF